MTAAASNILTWHEVCTDRSLRNLPYKIESTGDGKLLLSRFTNDRAFIKARLMLELKKRTSVGKVLGSVPVETSDGTRVTDVGWVTRHRWKSQRNQISATTAPDICVEIISLFNSREYAMVKLPLYFSAGAAEVWLCGNDGVVEFFGCADGGKAIAASVLCPEFPHRIELE